MLKRKCSVGVAYWLAVVGTVTTCISFSLDSEGYTCVTAVFKENGFSQKAAFALALSLEENCQSRER